MIIPCPHINPQLLKSGVSTSLRRLFAPSAILKGDFECNGDVSPIIGRAYTAEGCQPQRDSFEQSREMRRSVFNAVSSTTAMYAILSLPILRYILIPSAKSLASLLL